MSAVTCNPLDLDYRFQEVRHPQQESFRLVFREAADPSVVRYRGRYFMFASMSRGFWHSSDLLTWSYRTTDKLPALDYAPDVREVDGALVICASRRDEPSPFFRSEDPLSDDFVQVAPGTFDVWDPNLFQDGDGSLYLYWGCSSTTPLSGVQLDAAAFTSVGERRELLAADPAHRGWELVGEDHVQGPRFFAGQDITAIVGHDPFIEGAWVNEHEGTYYLQYAAPATEFNVYADGYATASSPLGPFEYSPHSPFSSKPGGFITGAGHGSTFRDEHGNWWHAATMRISVNHPFERRIGLFPAGFDDDGVLFCNQHFADYPVRIPDGRFDPWAVGPEWMLLSLGAAATASSSMEGRPPELAVEEDVRTWWAADDTAPGAWLRVDLGRAKTVHALQVNLADEQTAPSAPLRSDGAVLDGLYRAIDPESRPTELTVEVSTDGASWERVGGELATGGHPHGFVVLEPAVQARYVRVTAGQLPYGARFAVSGLRVFGTSGAAAPVAAAAQVQRRDPRTAAVSWSVGAGAQGCNVRYGTAPDKLYSSWQVHGRTSLELRGLNAGADYWVAVDAFGEGGVTPGEVLSVPSS